MTHEDKMRRARRIHRTLVVAQRRKKRHMRQHFNPLTGLNDVDCVCELANTYFAKAKDCRCSKRRKGAPRRDWGMCNVGERARIYLWRQEVTALRAEVRSGRVDTEDPDGY